MIIRFVIRNIFKNLKDNFIKTCGLVIAFLTIMFLSIWVFNELSYDKYHSNASRIYRLSVEQVEKEMNFTWHFARTWQTWRRDLPDYFPEIEEMAELVPLYTTTVKIETNKFTTRKAYASDSSLFKVFDFIFIEGNPIHSIDNKNSMVVSQEFANKYFPGKSAINKTLEIKGDNFDEFTTHTITGVFKDQPKNSHFQTDFIVNYPKPNNHNGHEWAYTYLLLKKGFDIRDIESKMPDFIKTHVPEQQRSSSILHFTPLTDIHLKSHIEREIQDNGDIRQVRFFILITIGIFLMVIINYINLNIVSYGKRLKAISVNKILGAKLMHNLCSLLVESLILATIALMIAIILYYPFKTLLNNLGIDYELNIKDWLFPHVALTLFIAHLIITISGSLPVFVSKFKQIPLFEEKNRSSLQVKTNFGALNNSMIVFQFSISIIVIICGLILSSQNKYLLNNQLGGRENNIISICREGTDEENFTFYNEIKKYPEIVDVTGTFDAPTYLIKDLRIVECNNIPENKKGQAITICPTDENFFNFFNLKLVAGRQQDPYQENQKYLDYIINEKAVKQLGFKSPEEAIGSDFKLHAYNDDIKYGGKIAGVVEDFYFSSLYHPIQATAYFQMPKYYGTFLVKTAPGMEQIAIKKIKKVWDKIFTDYPMDYKYLNDIYTNTYKKDLVQGKLFDFFSIISIIISSIGLIGILNNVLIHKTKEIGIRKVNGARISEVLMLLNRDFVKWVAIAFVLACPIAYYAMHKWLEGFAYKTELSWWIFALAGFISLAIALLTVSWQSWKAATRNPVEALRSE